MASETERKPLREWREEQLLTIGEVAQAVGVAPSSVRNWELYGIEPHNRSKRALAKLFNVRPDQILYKVAAPKARAA